jgi:drug/metabolite transporter (DMT)-like permease
MLGAVACWTLYSVLGRRSPSPPITSTAIQASLGVIVLLPVMAFTGFAVNLSAAGASGLAYIIVFPAVLSLALWNTAVRDVGPTRASGFLNLLPIFTAALAVALGAELAWPQILGGCLVIAGVFITSRVPINRRETGVTTGIPTR